MNERRLKVGIVAAGFKDGTGPATYYRALRETIGQRHDLCRLQGSCDGPVDLVHVIDAKRLPPDSLDAVTAPVIADFHDDYWIEAPKYFSPDLPLRRIRQKLLFRHHLEVLRKVSAVVVHSQSVAASFQPVLEKIREERGKAPALHVASLGVSGAAASTGDVNVSTREDDLILMVGRDIFRKGFSVMVKALPKIIKSRPPARLLVIGDEYFHTRAVAGLMARGLPIKFLSWQTPEDLAGWFGKASLLALPSFQEAFGLVLIEAMAAGLPVAASSAGGIPEAVEDGVSGLLHQPGDADDLAKKVLAILEDGGLRERLVRGGAERARLFSAERMADGIHRVYCSVVEHG